VQRRGPVSVRVVALGSNGRAGEGNAAVLVEKNKLKEMREESSSSPLIDDVDSKPTVAGGVQDVYGEDSATEDQFVTPWSVSVAR
jgi:malate dehydrogenase (oxaloacetate-decarboxylating)(NADP+)